MFILFSTAFGRLWCAHRSSFRGGKAIEAEDLPLTFLTWELYPVRISLYGVMFNYALEQYYHYF